LRDENQNLGLVIELGGEGGLIARLANATSVRASSKKP
jgi:hypothetical protein